ncbi:hypothetical protein D1B33_05435 [Lysinibacillus yapensis]|uniref:Uncharacterized protein n=1 Tax=Ureibacillus yapensis TaxID=2304605 RepID=A0A396SQ97_9BACL|nr:hypothetical protein D1B33_05435 [Lysinibacillus yapensis]
MRKELLNTKGQLSKIGGKADLKPKDEGKIQIYSFLLRGKLYEHRYMSIALRNHVENELNRRLGLPNMTAC